MSKNRHFLAYLLLPILVSGCSVSPLAVPPQPADDPELQQREEEKAQLERQIQQLEQALQASRQAKAQLQEDHQKLQQKMEALTDIERSLYQRRLENSE